MKGRTRQLGSEARLVGRTPPVKPAQTINVQPAISCINRSSCAQFPPPFPPFPPVKYPFSQLPAHFSLFGGWVSPEKRPTKNKKLPNEPISEIQENPLKQTRFCVFPNQSPIENEPIFMPRRRSMFSTLRVPRSAFKPFTNPIDRINHTVRTAHCRRPIKFS
jgi:hypothetical protein